MRPPTVIALVASAGGLDAIRAILAKLPPDFGAAVVVLLHQQPDRVSHLTEILVWNCPLEVVTAEDGAALEPGRVLVIPPGTHLLVTPEASVALIMSGSAPPSRPSADLLLATMATALGPRAIAVILSGEGHDGATGATAVHARGGIVIATDEASSSHFSMPLAAIRRDESVDWIVPLDEVAGLLIRLAAHEGAVRA